MAPAFGPKLAAGSARLKGRQGWLGETCEKSIVKETG
jgi:hypothetical protein